MPRTVLKAFLYKLTATMSPPPLWVCQRHSSSTLCMHAKSLQLCLTLLQTARLLCPRDSPGKTTHPPPGNLSDPGIKPVSLRAPALAGGFFTTSATWEALIYLRGQLYLLSVLCPPHWVPSTSLGQSPHVFSLFSVSITSSLAHHHFLLSYPWAF